jgi:glutamate synthase domain-containing protein 2
MSHWLGIASGTIAAMSFGALSANAIRALNMGAKQAQACHTHRCPTGVTTQDPYRQRALVVDDKAELVFRFHPSTLKALAEVIAASGLRGDWRTGC